LQLGQCKSCPFLCTYLNDTFKESTVAVKFYPERIDYCTIPTMPFSKGKKKATLIFSSIIDLSQFKNECSCDDFYVERDNLLMVGMFTEEQLQVANYTYGATCQLENGSIDAQ
jgi:hypothetical protein